MACEHLDQIHRVEPSADGCEECLKTGQPWLHLRICRTCGHVGCCDQSPGHHAVRPMILQYPELSSSAPAPPAPKAI